MALISPASSSQPSIFSPAFGAPRRKGLLIAVCMSFLLFQLLFLANSSYIFGILYRASTRIKAFDVLLVDFDGGVIGQSIRTAYSELRGDDFISLEESPSSQYGNAAKVEAAVCQGQYWGAIYIAANASQRLADALTGDAVSYNATSAAAVVNLGIRYPIVQQAYVEPAFATLFGAALSAYYEDALSSSVGGIAANLSAVAPVLAKPFGYATHDLAPTPQGSTPFYGTALTVFITLMQFFCILAFNGIWQGFGLYGGASAASQLAFRGGYSVVFTLVGSLLTVGYVWAFGESWPVAVGDGGQQFFGASWMVIWLGMHINWLVLDAVAGFLPMAAVPFFTFTWIIFNLASTVMPFEISPGVYRVGYVFPAYNTFEALVHVWSGSRGCYNRLYRNLPVLFAWELVALVVDFFVQVRRCRISSSSAAKKPTNASAEAGEEEVVSEETIDESDEKRKA